MFTPAFVLVKFVVLCVSLVVLMLRPDLALTLLLVNILVTVPESMHKGNIGQAAVAALLMAALAHFQFQRSLTAGRLAAFLLAYCAWNVAFYFAGHPDMYAAIPQVAVPVAVALWMLVMHDSPQRALWHFVLLRCAILIVLCLHVASPMSCHRIP